MSRDRLARVWVELDPDASMQDQLDEDLSPTPPDHHSVWSQWLRGEPVD